MLPAPQTSQSLSDRTTGAFQWQVGTVIFLLVFTLAVTIGLLTNTVRAERAHLLFAIPCLVPVFWYGLGLGLSRSKGGTESDLGLLLSCLGWFLLACSFLFKHFAVARAAAVANADALQASSSATLPCTIAGVLLIAAGAALAWQYWTRLNHS